MSLADRKPPTAEEYASWRQRFSNWGRWGEKDNFGTLNHITPDVRRAAAALVREGRSVSLGRPINTRASAQNPYPARFYVGAQGAGGGEYIGLTFHGFAQTHIDALCHITVDGQAGRVFYNNAPVGPNPYFPAEHTLTIDFWRDGIITRGVLYDIPRLRGTEYVTADTPVHGWDLQDAAKAEGIEPRPGDAVLVRMGFEEYYAAHPDESPGWGPPGGLHASAIEFLYDTNAALLSWDMMEAPGQDAVIPNPLTTTPTMTHIHALINPYMGMPMVDNAYFGQLARVCAEIGRWEVMYTLAPMIIVGATGSYVNPVAVY